MQDQPVSLIFSFAGTQTQLLRETIYPHETVEAIKNKIAPHVRLAAPMFYLSARNFPLQNNQSLAGLRDNEVVSIHLNSSNPTPIPVQPAPVVTTPSVPPRVAPKSEPIVTTRTTNKGNPFFQGQPPVHSQSMPSISPAPSLPPPPVPHLVTPTPALSSLPPAPAAVQAPPRSYRSSSNRPLPASDPPSISFLPPPVLPERTVQSPTALLSSFTRVLPQNQQPPTQQNFSSPVFISAPGTVSTARAKENPEFGANPYRGSARKLPSQPPQMYYFFMFSFCYLVLFFFLFMLIPLFFSFGDCSLFIFPFSCLHFRHPKEKKQERERAKRKEGEKKFLLKRNKSKRRGNLNIAY